MPGTERELSRSWEVQMDVSDQAFRGFHDRVRDMKT